MDNGLVSSYNFVSRLHNFAGTFDPLKQSISFEGELLLEIESDLKRS